MILLATIFMSLIAIFVGAFLVFSKKKQTIHFLLPFSAGAIMATALLDLVVESSLELGINYASQILTLGFIFFFMAEMFLMWRHCHDEECDVHQFAYLNLFGDAIHNFIDGIIIASAFLTNPNLGFVTTLAIITHEIPQEIADMGVIIYAGIKARKALFYNFLAQLTSVIGGLVGYFFSLAYGIAPYILAFAAGGFLYLSASDLIPQIKDKEINKTTILNTLLFLLGFLVIYFI